MRIVSIGIKNRNINVFADVVASIQGENLPLSIFIVSDIYRDDIMNRYQVPRDYPSFSLPLHGKIFLFDNALSSYESLCWHLVKELCHMSIRTHPTLSLLCSTAEKKVNTQSDFYEQLPENELCKQLATSFIGKSFAEE